MLERLLSKFRKRGEAKAAIDPQTGYPKAHMDILNKMARGEIPAQIFVTSIDDEGLPHSELFDIPQQKQGSPPTE